MQRYGHDDRRGNQARQPQRRDDYQGQVARTTTSTAARITTSDVKDAARARSTRSTGASVFRPITGTGNTWSTTGAATA